MKILTFWAGSNSQEAVYDPFTEICEGKERQCQKKQLSEALTDKVVKPYRTKVTCATVLCVSKLIRQTCWVYKHQRRGFNDVLNKVQQHYTCRLSAGLLTQLKSNCNVKK